MNDSELLQLFIQSDSREALTELVRRHIGWVHAAAMRRLRNEQHAQDVTQAAFLVLMQKPPRLRDPSAFSGWLLGVVYQLCNRVIRTESRRRKREKAFAMQQEEAREPMSQEEWGQLSPFLDEAVLSLREEDRRAVMLRFYEQKSHIEVAEAMGISHEAARQRVGRAVAKLREIFVRRNVEVPSIAILTSALSTNTASSNAAALQGALNATEAAIAGAVPAALIGKGVLLMLMLNKAKVITITAIAAVLLAGAAAVMILNPPGSQLPAVASAATQPAATQPAGDWRARFDVVYRLEPGQNVKLIPMPFIAERGLYFQEKEPVRARQYPDGPYVYMFRWDGAGISRASNGWTQKFGETSLEGVFTFIMNFRGYDVEFPEELKSVPVAGDWVVREGLSDEVLLDELCQMIQRNGGPAIRFEKQTRTRPVLVAAGKYQFRQAPGTREGRLALFVDRPDPADLIGGTSSNLRLEQLIEELGAKIGAWPSIETSERPSGQIRVDRHSSSYLPATNPARQEAFEKLLAVVSQQSGLDLRLEMREVPMWVVIPTKPTTKPAP